MSSVPYFGQETLDDVMREIIQELFKSGQQIHPSKGPATELTGVLLEITNPRARLSRTETKGKPFSCLGELCWYLSRSNDISFITYYLPVYKECAEGDIAFGGYGPRLFSWKGLNQMALVVEILKSKRDSRQAVIQLFDRYDISVEHKDVPCTCTLQFMLRNGKLDLIAHMRSNDVLKGLPHDVFCFTMLQEIVAVQVGAELGTYKHAVGSLHIYDESRGDADDYINEGFQSTNSAMPAMPASDPWIGIAAVLQAETELRSYGTFDEGLIRSVEPYWADLIRLLQVFRGKKDHDFAIVTRVQEQMTSNVYDPYIAKIANGLRTQSAEQSV